MMMFLSWTQKKVDFSSQWCKLAKALEVNKLLEANYHEGKSDVAIVGKVTCIKTLVMSSPTYFNICAFHLSLLAFLFFRSLPPFFSFLLSSSFPPGAGDQFLIQAFVSINLETLRIFCSRFLGEVLIP